MKRKLLLLLLVCVASVSYSQMWNGVDTLYGNEWINYEQSYFKIPVAEDGIYRVSYNTLQEAGIPLNDIQGQYFQLFHLGVEQPIYTSTAGTLSSGDYIEFWGEKNRDEVDRFLFANPDEDMLNPWYSLITDTTTYYLTWNIGESGYRYDNIDNSLVNLPQKEEWFWYEERKVYTDRAIHKINSEGVAESIFDTGEGFGTNLSSNQNFLLSPEFVAPIANNSQVTVRLVSTHGFEHDFELFIDDELVLEENWSGVALKNYILDKATNTLGDELSIDVKGLSPNNDRYSIGFVSLTYPRQFVFENQDIFTFQLSTSNNNRYIEITSFNNNGTTPVLYSLNNHWRMEGEVENGVIKFKLPPSNQAEKLCLVNPQEGITAVEQLNSSNFIDYDELFGNYVIISNTRLFEEDDGFNQIQEYADYRASTNGGDFSTTVVDVEQLYEQFAYGLNRHPIAIRNFAHYTFRNWTIPPEYFLLIGKAREYDKIRVKQQLEQADNQSFFVPTYGRPGSDNLMFGSVNSSVPIVPIGRIAAESPREIGQYLEKVKGFESSLNNANEADRIWRKKLIHLGGGGSASEQNSIRNNLEIMEGLIENNEVGGDVLGFYKTSSDPIQQSQSEQITNRINEGVGIITFFGHAGTGGFDFSIDDPSTYENTNKYPLLFSLGCLSGQMHGNTKSVGENFIFQDERGSVAFFASVGLGYVFALNNLARTYYDFLGGEYFGSSIGTTLRASLALYDASTNLPTRSLNQQFSLHGDPAIILHPWAAPDYKPLGASVDFQPEIINAQMDSFTFSVDIQNLGRGLEDSLTLELQRQLPNGARITIVKEKIFPPKFKSTYSWKLPVLGEQAIGFNRFFIEVDPENTIDELPLPYAENNNKLIIDAQEGISIFVFANGTTTVYPPEYAIIGAPKLELQASTADIFATSQDYVFEIDTTARFDSPLKASKKINQRGGLLQWDVSTFLQGDSTVYYWRVSQDSTTVLGYQWSESSFVYLPAAASGWNQSHFYQLTANTFQNVRMDSTTRELEYLDDVKTYRVKNGIYPEVWPEIAVNNDSYLYIPWDNATSGGLMICVIYPITGDPWINHPPGDYGSNLQTPWAQNWVVFPYDTRTTEWREKAINFLRDTIPSGHYVLLYTIQHTNQSYEPWEWAMDSVTLGTNLFQVLEEQGSMGVLRIIADIDIALPYTFFYKKDDPSFEFQELLGGATGVVSQAYYISGTWDNGTLKSSKIGPAKKWERFEAAISEKEPLDEYGFNIYGVRSDSTFSLIYQDVDAGSLDISEVDAGIFPYLEVHYSTTDTLNRSSPQLDYWRVYYEGIPEAVLDPNTAFTFYQDTLQQGDQMRIEMGVVNVSDYDMDSLLVKYTIIDEANNTTTVNKRFRALNSQDTLITDFSLDTRAIAGRQQIIIEANPANDQAELIHFNNIGYNDFYVEKDKKNPLLDITFDGLRIVNGDIVSSSPHIVIRLEDENPFLALSDTGLLKVLLKYPNSNDVIAIPFSDERLQFYPEQGDNLNKNNRATIEFKPLLEESGRYSLIVQARDATGNTSGQFDYKTDFEVILEKQISNIFNYPNPFSTSTHFVYTLTGNEPPAYFSIRIMTISGRVVRELTQDELGPLKIGTHRTDFAWDGTDQFGDRLANGVYLYRIMAKDLDGKNYDKFDNNTDRYFKNDFGKLVILR